MERAEDSSGSFGTTGQYDCNTVRAECSKYVLFAYINLLYVRTTGLEDTIHSHTPKDFVRVCVRILLVVPVKASEPSEIYVESASAYVLSK